MGDTMNTRHSGVLAGLRKQGAAVIALLAMLQGTALANPSGPQVINGQASFSTVGTTLSVTNSPNTIINWNSFSINSGELTRFIQQSSASAILNRVTGGNASAIYGALQSNGRVFLINQNGILFGPGAQVDVNGLIASTLDISNADFLAGRFRFFTGVKSAGIDNQGRISSPSGGSIYLIAPDITNSGIINAPNGDILLAAGHTVNLVDSNNPDMATVVSAPENQALNLGQIIAQAGRIGIYGGIIAQKGIVSANSAVADKSGRIFFKATKDITLDAGSITTANGATGGEITIQSQEGTTWVSGTVEAKGVLPSPLGRVAGGEGVGGTVRLLGQQVGLIDQGSVDASGATGGGTVLVGGDYQGKNRDIPNARAVYMGKDTVITANATENGNGGKVIVWSDDTTRAYGSISARGGANGGNGGFVETSGHTYLDFQGRVDTQAPHGSAGTLLLDPADITIDTTADNLAGGTLGGGYFSGATGNSILTWGTINTQSGNLEIRTNSAGTGGNGDININASGVVTGPTTLTLLANRDINLGTGVSVSGAGDFNLISGWNNTGWAVNPGSGNINFGNGSSLSTTGNLSFNVGNAVNEAGTAAITANTLNVAATAGITLPGANAINSFNATNSGSGAITLTNTIPLSITGINQSGGGDITITNAGNPANDITVDGPITYSGTTLAALKLLAGRAILVNQPITSTASLLNVTLNAHAGADADLGSVGIMNNITTNGGNLVIGGGLDPTVTPAIGYGPGGTNDELYGVNIDNASISTSGGHITIRGRGVADSIFDADGIYLGTAQLHAGGGNITLIGQAGSNPGNASEGVYISNNVDTIGAGFIDIQGTGGSNTSAHPNRGVHVVGASTVISTVDGTLSVTGSGGIDSTNSTNDGVWISAGTLKSTGSGSITLTGTAGSTFSKGIINGGTISGANSVTLNAGTGTFSQTGTAKTKTTNTFSTLDIKADSILLGATTSLGTGPGGTVIIEPVTVGRDIQIDTATRAAGKLGLLDTDFYLITATSGTIQLGNSTTGTITVTTPIDVGTSSGSGLGLTAGTITLGGGANVTGHSIDLVADTMFIDATINAGYYPVSLQPLTPSTAIQVGAGAASSNGTLGLSDTLLNKITANGLTIGSASSGDLIVVGATNLSNNGPVTLTTGGKMDINAALSTTAQKLFLDSGGNLTINAPITSSNAAGMVYLGSGGTISQTSWGTITANSLALKTTGTGGVDLSAAPNSVANLSALAGGAFLKFNSSGAMHVAADSDGSMNMISGITVGAGGTVSLSATGAVTQSIAATISATNLAVQATGGISLDTGANNVAAIKLSNAGTGDIRYKNGRGAGNTLDVTAHNTASGGNIAIQEVTGNINLAGGASTTNGGGYLSLTAAGNITQTDGTIASQQFMASGKSVTLTANNSTGVIAGEATGSAPSDVFAYTSTNGIQVTTVNGKSGIGAANGIQLTSTTMGIGQDNTAPLTTSAGLTLSAAGPVNLTAPTNSVRNITASLTGTGNLTFNNYTPLTVASPGITTSGNVTLMAPSITIDAGGANTGISGATVTLQANRADGSITMIGDNGTPSITVTDSVQLEADNFSQYSGSITASTGEISIHPFTAGRSITVGDTACATLPCLLIANSSPAALNSRYLVIGSEDKTVPGDIVIGAAGIDRGIDTGNTLVLLTGGNITQAGGITADNLAIKALGAVTLSSASNRVTTLADKSSALAFTDSATLTIGTVSGAKPEPPYYQTLSGVSANGAVRITAPSGLKISSPIKAGSGAVTLAAVAGSITSLNGAGVLDVSGASLSIASYSGSGTLASPLDTQVSSLSAANSTAGDIAITNSGALTITALNNTSAAGRISIDNTGAVTTGASPIEAGSDVSIIAHSPLTIGAGGVTSTTGNINLEAGATGAEITTDNLTLNGPLSGTDITLKAGNDIVEHSTIAARGIVSKTGNRNTSSGPTIDQCIHTPALDGCSAVLPTLAACTATPALAGCAVVLPTLATCTANPALAGCSAVLPSLAACITTPTLAGCAAVLPTLAACTTAPTLAGCSAVLPTLAACTVTPALAGCAVVLPTLTACTANPTLAGCSAVLPTLAACTATPTLAGCMAVLPTLAACTADPALAGCSVVLPACSAGQVLAGGHCLASLSQPELLPQSVQGVLNRLTSEINQTSSATRSVVIAFEPVSSNSSASSSGTSSGNPDDKKDADKDSTQKSISEKRDEIKQNKLFCN